MPKITYESKELEIPKEALDELMEKYGKKSKRREYGDAYWYINNMGMAACTRDSLVGEDEWRWETGNYFKTEAHVNTCIRDGWHAKRLAQVRIERFIIENGLDFAINWKDFGQTKYEMFYDHETNKFEAENCWKAQCASGLLFSSKADCKKVIDNCEADLKILFGIK